MTVPLLTPHLSHHNFLSQLITTYHIPTHHSSTSHNPSHTSLITSELITAPLLTPDITSPLLTPHFSHLPEVYINLRIIKAWHVGLSGPFIFWLISLMLINLMKNEKCIKSACFFRAFVKSASKVHQKCKSAKVHLITFVKFTNISKVLVSLVKIYVHPR